jgi:small subunit ribosomal protein S6
MRRYETICIVNPNLDADSLKEVVAKFSGVIQKLKGYLFAVNEWGKMKLAYEVKKFDKGYYLVLDFCGLPVVVRELERSLKLDDRILKYITVKIGEDVDTEDLVSKGQEKEDKREETHKESTKKDNGL